ncbi:MAG: hypothetical protein PHT33_09760 [bacterium]|nr:hypothetical protein [bacterium]
MRCVPVLKKIKDIIGNGDIGEIMAIESREVYDGGFDGALLMQSLYCHGADYMLRASA